MGGHFLPHGTTSQIPVHNLFDPPVCNKVNARFILFLDPHVEHLKKLKATPAKPGVRLNFAKKVGWFGRLEIDSGCTKRHAYTQYASLTFKGPLLTLP